MDANEIFGTFDKYVISNYGRLKKAIVKGSGNYIYDEQGNEILDMFPGWAVSGLGHCHPNVVEAIRKQAGELLHIDNTFYIPNQGRLAQLLSERSFGGKCFFCNSGAEANEAAMKLARIHTPKEKYKFITAEGSFHGRTFATLTATAQPGKHDGFLPLLPGFEYVPFNDIEALEEAFTDEVAAVMVEPVQGEGGINLATAEYIAAIRRLCDENGAVMILDEVQTGLGRTGKWFGYQQFDIEPDIITLAKSLGSGVPIGAIIAQNHVAASLKPGTHASTYGGNPLVCAAAIAVIETIEKENLLQNAIDMGNYAAEKIKELAQGMPVIEEVRNLGLMIGIKLTSPGAEIVNHCLEKGLRINCTQGNIIRFMPSMVVTADQIDKAVAIFAEVLKEQN
jgi:predicted acetylornithine/succinylornithine family transaminase